MFDILFGDEETLGVNLSEKFDAELYKGETVTGRKRFFLLYRAGLEFILHVGTPGNMQRAQEVVPGERDTFEYEFRDKKGILHTDGNFRNVYDGVEISLKRIPYSFVE